MIPYLLICEKIGNDPLLIGNVETDMSQLSNGLHNTDDVLEKVDVSYEIERIADELVLLEEIYSHNSELNMEYSTSDMEKCHSDFVGTESHRKDDIRYYPVQPSSSEIRRLNVEEMNKKSVLCQLERQKEKLMACRETKSPVRRKRKYTARKDSNENNSRINELKLMKQQKRISRLEKQSNTKKEGKTLMKQEYQG